MTAAVIITGWPLFWLLLTFAVIGASIAYLLEATGYYRRR